jgi:hypothetical protein
MKHGRTRMLTVLRYSISKIQRFFEVFKRIIDTEADLMAGARMIKTMIIEDGSNNEKMEFGPRCNASTGYQGAARSKELDYYRRYENHSVEFLMKDLSFRMIPCKHGEE